MESVRFFPLYFCWPPILGVDINYLWEAAKTPPKLYMQVIASIMVLAGYIALIATGFLKDLPFMGQQIFAGKIVGANLALLAVRVRHRQN